MTKQEVADKICKRTMLTDVQSKAAVEAFMVVIKEALKEKKSVFMRGFGTFYPKKQAEKTARNISKGTKIIIPARVVPAFKPCKDFKQSVE